MCTLSWLPHPDGYTFWHGRDERTTRLPGEPPRRVLRGGLAALAPRDGDAGGTWISVHQNGNAIVLLNGGLVKHIPAPPYRKSRGLILLDLLSEGGKADGGHEAGNHETA